MRLPPLYQTLSAREPAAERFELCLHPWCNIAMIQPNGLLGWWSRHSLVSLLLTGGALAGAIPKYTELIQRGITWFRNRRAKKIERYIPGEDQWERVRNGRFCFAFSYPRAWERQTSTNSDGHTISHPTIKGISIIGWGEHASVLEDADIVRHGLGEDGSRTISRSEITVPMRTSAQSTTMIDAERTVFNIGDTRMMQVYVGHEGREVHLRCTAPIQYYDEFEGVFLTACHTLALLPLNVGS
jgi:hypothetical protein